MDDVVRQLREDAEDLEGQSGGELPHMVDNMRRAACEIERLRAALEILAAWDERDLCQECAGWKVARDALTVSGGKP